MKTSHISLFILLFLSLAVVSAKAQERRTFDLATFERLSISIPAQVELRQGNTQKIEIEASDELFDKMKVEVDKDRLRIKMKEKNWRWNRRHGEVKVWITVASLEEISLAGSGSIKGKDTFKAKNFEISVAGSGDIALDLRVDKLDISIAGSGDVVLKGSAKKVDVSIAGSGNLEADKLETRNCEVSISGSGDCHVNVSESLDASIAGSGSVIYSGSPKQINTSSLGSGKVKKAS